MNDPHRIKLVLFSNTYPFGGGETFLADEIPYLAEQFHRITIFPLYRPDGEMRPHPASVDIATPLLPFDHKDRKGFLKKGLFNTAPFFFATKEFFRAVFGKRNKKAGLGRRLHIFFNYFLMLRTILGNKKLMEEVVRECCFADKIYFYWGDKSAMLIPFLKKLVKPNVEIMPMFCAWLCDTFALFIGRSFGKHKMAPKISPKKSVEGAIAGIVGTTVSGMIAFFVCDHFFFLTDTIRWWMVLAYMPVGCIMGMCGDLAASVIKRNYGVKDFGTLFPEHGGAMDRVDSFLFTMPSMYILMNILLSIFVS